MTNLCPRCGRLVEQPVIRRRPRVYCSMTCKNAAAVAKKAERETGTCAHCGKPSHGNRKYCSRECRSAAAAGNRMATCLICGRTFRTRGECKSFTPKTCGRGCAQKLAGRAMAKPGGSRESNNRYIRRARTWRVTLDGRPIDRNAIFERDRCRCYLCNEPLQMDKPPHHPLSATVDHVIPLSLGGKHTPENMRAAHMACNSRHYKSQRRAVLSGHRGK